MSGSGSRSDGISNVASRVVVVGNPAPGADWSFTTTAVGMLVAGRAVFTASAVVANRIPRIQIQDPATNLVWFASVVSAITAGQVFTISWGSGLSGQNSGGVQNLPLPLGLVVPVGSKVQFSTVALDVGDQWSGIVLTFSG